MAVTENIAGRFVDLKSIDESDAEFTLNIRKVPEFVKYLLLIDNTIDF